ncbi:DUF3302 domain-containing protein [Lysobacter auxotrophicus]|uniref:DUF3302 domain-containing protein n=1 Tax=Lysobacter auxotrophicus TaxID=2992573 RepID=A0ABN6UJN9_9GAMM|nr:DUF3302 domain-containing protein [Lysobacter auxotrophicus]BDU16446.1 DUF3302 domain-containing protein [Lysobacter auxotrophicus]
MSPASTNPRDPRSVRRGRRALPRVLLARTVLASALLTPCLAHASLLSGDALDAMANAVAWLALIVVPVVLIAVFWIVHILPEQIAEKRKHPQLDAIKTLCLLSLVFGGLLWPLAWLWAYTRPVLHKMAYGTDTIDHHGHGGDALTPLHDAEVGPAVEPAAEPEPVPGTRPRAVETQAEVDDMRRRIRSLEMALAMGERPGERSARTTPGGDEE